MISAGHVTSRRFLNTWQVAALRFARLSALLTTHARLPQCGNDELLSTHPSGILRMAAGGVGTREDILVTQTVV